MTVLLYVGVVIITVTIVVLVIVFSKKSGSDLRKGNFYTCAGRGCKSNETGEHETLEDCRRVCSSYINEKGFCEKVQGVPWNSFSNLKACRDHGE